MKLNKKRGQAALEFLTTYGWVLLIIVIVLGVLIYFGALQPERLTPEKCVLSAGSGLQCEECSAREGSVTFRIANGAGSSVMISEIDLEGKGKLLDCMPWTGTRYIAADSKEDFTIFCPSIKEGEKLNAVISVKFSEDGGLIKATGGEVLTNIGAGTGGGPGPGPQSDMECTLTPAEDVNLAGDKHIVVATVTENGVPVSAGMLIQFDVQGKNSYSAMRLTNDSGQATLMYPDLAFQSGDEAEEVDSIYACHFNTTTGQNDFCCSAKKTWTTLSLDYIRCELTPDYDKNVVYGKHVVTATVTRNGVPLSGAKLKFFVDGVSGIDDVDRCPDWPPIYPQADENPFGTSPIIEIGPPGIYYYIYRNRGFVGKDTIYAIGEYYPKDELSKYNGIRFMCNKVEKEWYMPSVRCELNPKNQTKVITPGQQNLANVTITLTQGGVPVPDLLNLVWIVGGGTGDHIPFPAGPSSPSSKYTFEFPNLGEDIEGVDTIEARGNYGSTLFNCSASIKWTNAIVACELTPLIDVNPVDSKKHTVTIKVFEPRSSDTPEPPPGIEGVTVNFYVTGLYTPQEELLASGTNVTDPDGYASFTYFTSYDDINSQVPGYDLIVGQGTYLTKSFSCKAAKIWTYPVARCSIEPVTAKNARGTQHEVKITVEKCDDSHDVQNCYAPLPGTPIRLDIVGASKTTSPVFLQTDLGGKASYSYINSEGNSGIDYISASGKTDDDPADIYAFPFFCTAIKDWV